MKLELNRSGTELKTAKNGRSVPVPFRIFEFGTSSVLVPEISELVPELEQKFRSGPITGPWSLLKEFRHL